jgi:flagellar protein FlbD
MIIVKKLTGEEYALNSDLIESIESTPDTVITLTTGKKIVVLNSVDDIIDKIIQYKRSIFLHTNIIYHSPGKEV